MCGIAGGIHSGLNNEQITDVLRKLRHRGPDDSGLYSDEKIWLGNTRLAIQDLSQHGHQPMQTSDGRFTIVFNGEIYNQTALRISLKQKGVHFVSACDTETLLHAFVLWGEDCLKMLEGDYAFAVFDKAKNEVFIARDPMGVKPLYYYFDSKQFLFASELKALTGLPYIDYSLQPESFFQYLLFQYNPSENTPFRNFKKLLPGHFLRIDLGKPMQVMPQRFYSIPFSGKYAHQSKEEWIRHLDQSLSGVVSRQLSSDAPLGFALSGGLDSSLIAALARKADPIQSLHAFTINTHGAMKKEGFEDDFSFAKLVAKQQNMVLHEVSGLLNIEAELDEMIWQLDEPQADPAALHMRHISKAANEAGFKVLLSGTGGDDLFSGYRRHTALPVLKLLKHSPQFLKQAIDNFSKKNPDKIFIRRLAKLLSGAGLSLEDAIIQTHFWIDPKFLQSIFKTSILQDDISLAQFNLFHNLFQEIPDEKSNLNKMLFLEQRTFLPHHNLAYMDKLGMAHSVEVRVPFVDKEIVNLAASIPPGLKLHNGTTKYLLRELAKNYLPSPVIKRQKTGFGAPLRQMIKSDLQDFVKVRLLDDSFINRGFFSKQSIERLIQDNQEGKIDGSYTLFSLLAIESWLRQFVPTT